MFISNNVTNFFKSVYSQNTINFQNNFLRNITEDEKKILDGLTSKGHDPEIVMVRFYSHKYELALDRLVKSISKCKINQIQRLRSLAVIYNDDILSELTY